MSKEKSGRSLLIAGLILVSLGLLTGVVAPAFGPPRESGQSQEKRAQQDAAARRFTARVVSAFCLFVGLGSGLTIAGLVLRAKKQR